MNIATPERELRATVDAALDSIASGQLRMPAFAGELENRFEKDTRKARSRRMWFEGLLAIIVLNVCLLLDFIFVKDPGWRVVALHTAVVTPLSLLINLLIKSNPTKFIREGSIAASMFGIGVINLLSQGHSSVAPTLFGEICLLIIALFVGVVMRLRFAYVVGCLLAMLCSGIASLGLTPNLEPSAMVMGDSLLLIGFGIILIASFSLERAERENYLLMLVRQFQAEELTISNHALAKQSRVDQLTNLPNRRAFEETIEKMWSACYQTGKQLAIVVVDVDHFKVINDVYGHLYGDDVLRRLGSLLPQALRSPKDMAARYGGEEFVLLLEDAGADVAMTVAERARELIETAGTPLMSLPSGGAQLWVTISCGVSWCVPGRGQHWTELLAAADKALYSAKHAGRNRVEFLEQGLSLEHGSPVEQNVDLAS